MLAPVQASIAAGSGGMAAMMDGVKMDGEKGQPCPCEKFKMQCGMKLCSLASCAAFHMLPLLDKPELAGIHDGAIFARLIEVLIPTDPGVRRRPPRV